MSESDDFLARWARRKREVARQEKSDKQDTEKPAKEPSPVRSESDRPAGEERVSAKKPRAKNEQREEPAFDLSKLPSIESITATSDIRPFLAAGVPAALRNAALRRMWSADPAIREFIEVAENQWDFNAPGIPGFDLSPPTGDIRRMLADIFGEKLEDDDSKAEKQERVAARDAEPEQIGSESAQKDEQQLSHRNVIEQPEELASPESERESVPPAEPTMENAQNAARTSGQTPSDDAPQKDAASHDNVMRVARRSHGSAVPR